MFLLVCSLCVGIFRPLYSAPVTKRWVKSASSAYFNTSLRTIQRERKNIFSTFEVLKYYRQNLFLSFVLKFLFKNYVEIIEF